MASKTATLTFIGILLLATAGAVPQTDPRNGDALKAEAERFYAEKSFARAAALYEQASKLELTETERRWVEMRIADTAWRADAASPSPDSSSREKPRIALETLIRDTDEESRDLAYAEANESLGDYYATHPYVRNLYSANPYYRAALDWWAGSDDIAAARDRYLALVWKIAPAEQMWNVPRDVLVNAVKIADSAADRTHARYVLAFHFGQMHTPASLERALELYDEVLREGKASEYYDDALYQSALILTARNEYVRAVERHRRLVAEFKESTSRHYRAATQAIEQITKPSVQVQATATFLPGIDQGAVLQWRNVKAIELTLFAVDLTKDARPEERGAWIESIRTENRPVVRRWTFETRDDGTYKPGFEILRLEPKLDAGAYVLAARAGKETARTLVLVTDAHILVHSGSHRMQVYVSDVVTGQPIANARVHIWSGHDPAKMREWNGQTGKDGRVPFTIDDDQSRQLLVTATAGSRQAFFQSWIYGYGSRQTPQWRVYAFTDRPAYRPEETVRWKMIARLRDSGEWITPSGRALTYEIMNPRGEKVASGSAKLNAFGSFWSELELDPSMVLGAYTVTFRDGDHHAESADLFQLEEYKLPEFAVNVTTPKDRQYRLGDTIEATIEASYYFGGPVANADVEAVVHRQPLVRHWYPWREYPWYWERTFAPSAGEVVSTENLRTDAEGRAVLRIDTNRDDPAMTYRIEARVVDASRREVSGAGSVRVMKQRYDVIAQPEHFVHRPGETAAVKFKASDANDEPVRTMGTVTVVRKTWRVVDREGRYDEDAVLTTKLETDAAGEARLAFVPRKPGYYAVRWESVDGDAKREQDRVTAETTIWVADRATIDLGYHAPGLAIIVDRETARSGQTATAMIVAPASGRWVVLSTSGEDLLDTQVLHLDGTAKLVQIPIDDRHVPNFHLLATSVFDRQIATDTQRIVVPPVEHFLEVAVTADREQYGPREEGTLTIETRDVDGHPVAAEVAVSVSDEAVTAIAKDPAGDPRQFFFSDTRMPPRVQSGLQNQRYVAGDEEEKERENEERGRRDGSAFNLAGVGVARDAVSQSITVTASSLEIPKAAPAPMRQEAMAKVAEEPASSIDVQVRSDFRSTALWVPDVVTDARGTATVKVRFPESLTTWRANARAATRGSQFGMGTSTSRTNLPLIVRLQGPRFFVAGDEVVVSSVMNNNTDAAMTVTPSLEVEGLRVVDAHRTAVEVPPHGEARADWTVRAETAGAAKLRVAGRADRHSDAMEKSFRVYEHGVDKLIARSGKLRGEEAIVRLALPQARRETVLTVQVAPSLAAAMLDALPYLIEYPYGCTEQTMSRFLPAAIVARTLEKLGLARARIAGKDLDDVTAKGMARLYDMQHGDGGWGWWKDGDSDPYMTAYVVWGFAVAREGGLAVRKDAVDRGAQWLESHLVTREGQWHDQAWMLHALSAWRGRNRSAVETKAYDDVWSHRDRLTAFSRALLALTAHRYGDSERAAVIVRNLEDGVTLDRTPDQSVLLKGETAAETMATAHWGATRFWWRWYEGPVETTAFVLQALSTIDPNHRLVEPAMNWLVKNRRGAQWNNTRDTAIVILALNDYLARSGELKGGVSYEVLVNGHSVAAKSLTAADVLGAPSRFPIDEAWLAGDTQEIRIRRTKGTAPLYFAAEARFVSLEEPVTAAGNEIFVRREYFRLRPRPTLLKGILYDRVPLRDGESIQSGERVDVVVTVESKNDYDYLLFEDLKPGGFEAVALQSGEALWATEKGSNRTRWVYQELRDRKVAMFVDHLPQGVWAMSYALRAETPGSFHALPLLGEAMYVPEIRANGDEVRVRVEER